MRFREHRGDLAASKETEVELPDKEALTAHIQKLLALYGREVIPGALHINSYYEQTFIVTLDGYGVLGFCEDYQD